MSAQPQFTAEEVCELRGGFGSLFAQLGRPAALAAGGPPAAGVNLTRIESVPALRLFLRAYVTEILLPLELPTIARAFSQAQRNELRELLETTRTLRREPLLRDFAAASQRVGGSHLDRLRPLVDQRLVRRFREAVAAGQASPWHTVVFGLTLAIYSLPLRQGLVHYARQMLGGFIATATVPMDDATADELLEELCLGLAAGVDAVVTAHMGGGLRVV